MKISYEEFKKMDLRIGKVIEAERIPGKTKILKLKVDVGTATLQIVAGGAKHYPPDFFKGRQVVVLTNLESRRIAGVESTGMILAADHGGKPVWLGIEQEVPPGTIVR